MPEYVTYEEFCLDLPGEEKEPPAKGPTNWWASLSEDEIEERIQYFKQYGFETLVMWDSQIWHSDGHERIKSFCSSPGGRVR